ncbi:hypothetical protein BDZ89DRAFT_1094412 [Hymenopellis radicata]|nr:hypothetical protein BDZ89DRAFT_1094412 [Hymenopellis radicata]
MSALLQDLLRQSTISDSLRDKEKERDREEVSDDEELVGVVSLPGTPSRTRPSSPQPQLQSRRSGLSSLSVPTNGAVLPTELSQRIFSRLPVKDLARCSLVCRKWARSQTINYAIPEREFHDESLPPGKWTKRESKVNWRTTHMQSLKSANSESRSGHSTPSYQTPREQKEAQWRLEAEVTRPGKNEMREMYKEFGGRKVRGKVLGVGGGGGKGDRRGVKDKAGVGWDAD